MGHHEMKMVMSKVGVDRFYVYCGCGWGADGSVEWSEALELWHGHHYVPGHVV